MKTLAHKNQSSDRLRQPIRTRVQARLPAATATNPSTEIASAMVDGGSGIAAISRLQLASVLGPPPAETSATNRVQVPFGSNPAREPKSAPVLAVERGS